MKRHFILAFRNLLKYKTFSAINIFGLGLGMAGAFMILQFIIHEKTYDHFHEHAERIFRIQRYNPRNTKEFADITRFSGKVGSYLKENDPAIESYVRIFTEGGVIIRNPDYPTRRNVESNFAFVDTSFFSIFTFNLRQGNSAQLIAHPSTVIISKRIAEKYFGDRNPVGQQLEFKGNLLFQQEGILQQAKIPFQVTPHLLEVVGVMENPPVNSTFQFDFISSLNTKKSLDTLDRDPHYETFLLLKSGTTQRSVEVKLKAAFAFLKGFDYEEHHAYRLQPFLSRHPEENPNTVVHIRILTVVAAVILFLALFNYINLTTARASVRAKEVGIRKTLGVSRFSLLAQFFTESFLTVLGSFALALVFVAASQPVFNAILGIQFSLGTFLSPIYVVSLLVMLIGVALISGIYPALVLSGFPPVRIFSWNASLRYQGINVRRLFITLQFITSAVLILVSMVVQKQINFMKDKNPGFNKEQLLVVNLGPRLGIQSQIFKHELKNQYGFRDVALSSSQNFSGYNGSPYYNPRNQKQGFIISMQVDGDFLEMLGVKMNVPLNKNIGPDANGYRCVLTKQAVKELGFNDQNAVGEDIFSSPNTPMGKIAGVVEPLDLWGPKHRTDIFLIQVHDGKTQPFGLNNLFIRLNPKDNISEKIALLEKVYQKYEAEWPFRYQFADDSFNQIFKEELIIIKIATIFTTIAILLACLGLFGLITFTTQTRTKEIGIRKTLGADLTELVHLLSADFLKLVTFAVVIALPLAYYIVRQWLQDFPYQTEVSWWIYALTTLITLGLAAITVGTQSARAALINPVESLKVE